ncbi:ketopantoate reductase family protein [Alicyclobacillus sp. SO9]|uniref:ketopantoate reductase family protein n=1 Tax=Alicyclobacillus sp. SO9 TaxID=2665646 RepID=UPI0018E8D434|nr:ketopantoate reductase family protein [Alicyclobacillus sp. SO9]QQE80145.1 ketopantoate reductase family protein [Alicyclobacillus sp. SO9]
MHIVVFGAGAVGGYFGGKLAQTGNPVTFLVRQNRYHQLKTSGLTIQSVHGNFTIQPELALSPEEIDKPDVVLLAVKNYHLDGAMSQLQTLVNKGAKILPLLNGVEHIDVLLRNFGDQHVLGGTCYIESTLDAEGGIVHTSPMHDIVFGSLGHVNEEWLGELLHVFQRSGINVTQSHAILKDMWTKFVFLTSISGLTAAARSPIGVILNDAVARELLEHVIREVVQVANLRGIKLPVEETIRNTMTKMEGMSPTMTSSLHRDLEKGLPLEISSLQGAVVKMAIESGLAVPHVASVYAVLHPFETGQK